MLRPNTIYGLGNENPPSLVLSALGSIKKLSLQKLVKWFFLCVKVSSSDEDWVTAFWKLFLVYSDGVVASLDTELSSSESDDNDDDEDDLLGDTNMVRDGEWSDEETFLGSKFSSSDEDDEHK